MHVVDMLTPKRNWLLVSHWGEKHHLLKAPFKKKLGIFFRWENFHTLASSSKNRLLWKSSERNGEREIGRQKWGERNWERETEGEK